MQFADGQKRREYMKQLVKDKPYIELSVECACQKHGCRSTTKHAIWHVGKQSFLLRPLCPKCADEASQPTQGVAKEKKTQQAVVAKPESTPKMKDKKPVDKPKEQGVTNEELSRRIAQLEEVPFKQRTMAEAQELNDLLIMRKRKRERNNPNDTNFQS
jgi:hypothetical protein